MPIVKDKKLLVIADSPGPADSLLSLLPLLDDKVSLQVFAVGKPCDILKQNAVICLNSLDEAKRELVLFCPDAVLHTVISLLHGPFIANDLVRAARQKGLPIMMFQDFWANHRWPNNREMFPNWDSVLTVDDLAKQFLLNDSYTGEVYVTGNPAYDKFFSIDSLSERRRLRKALDIAIDRPVVIYAGQGTSASLSADEEAFAFLCDVLRLLSPTPAIIVRAHPRSESVYHYQKYSEGLHLIHTPEFLLTDELLPVADVIVSMFSSNLIHASILDIPAVSLILPKVRDRLVEIRLDDFPLNITGATHGVYEPDLQKTAEYFRKLFDQKAPRPKARRTHFSPGATERTLQAILSFIGRLE
jgi:hypothetical protein